MLDDVRLRLTVNFDVYPRLRTSLTRDDRVQHHADRAVGTIQSCGNRVNNERSVLGDNLNNGVLATPPVVGDGRGEDTNRRYSKLPMCRDGAHAEHRPDEVGGLAADEVISRAIRVKVGHAHSKIGRRNKQRRDRGVS